MVLPSAPSAGSAAAPASGPAAVPTWWRAPAGATWQVQYAGKLDLTVKADIYDIDGADSTKAQVDALHAAGRKVLCYVNVGAYENWRADAARFPAAVRGTALDGWPGERWLDVRQWGTLRPILTDRFATCKAKGFDAVDPDNMDGYANANGFRLTAQDQLTFNTRIAALAHAMGLGVGLKNDLDQAAALQPSFDFAVNESCVEWNECSLAKPFITAGKPVFHVEYAARFCPAAASLKFSSVRKHLSLDAYRVAC